VSILIYFPVHFYYIRVYLDVRSIYLSYVCCCLHENNHYNHVLHQIKFKRDILRDRKATRFSHANATLPGFVSLTFARWRHSRCCELSSFLRFLYQVDPLVFGEHCQISEYFNYICGARNLWVNGIDMRSEIEQSVRWSWLYWEGGEV